VITLQEPNWELENVETVLFDKDGTIIDANVYWGRIIEIRAELLNQSYPIPTDALSYIMGYDFITKKLLPEGPIGLYSRAKVIDTLISNCRHFYSIHMDKQYIELIFDRAQSIFQKELLHYVKMLSGVEKLMYNLYRNHIKIGIVTSDSAESTSDILNFLQLLPYINVIVGRESCKESKETGIPGTNAMKQLYADPSTTIVIGDSYVDLIMAQNCNCFASVGVSTGQTDLLTLSKYSTFVTSSLANLVVENRR